jgi:Immunoglobulin I-set domain
MNILLEQHVSSSDGKLLSFTAFWSSEVFELHSRECLKTVSQVEVSRSMWQRWCSILSHHGACENFSRLQFEVHQIAYLYCISCNGSNALGFGVLSLLIRIIKNLFMLAKLNEFSFLQLIHWKCASLLAVKPYLDPQHTSSDTAADKGEDIDLTCNATGRPSPTIEWSRLGGALLPIGQEKLQVNWVSLL